jgi:sulfide:quinone oxidoreductase
MSKHIVILGAGFGGLELATRLSESVPDEARVTLIDKNAAFMFGFSKLDVMFDRRPVSELWHSYRDVAKPGLEFRQETVTSIDPENRRVVTNAATYDADILVVALGADYDVAATPGLAEDGYEFYSPAGAERARDVLAGFGGGAVVVGVLGGFFKCPGRPMRPRCFFTTTFLRAGCANRRAFTLSARFRCRSRSRSGPHRQSCRSLRSRASITGPHPG